MSPAIAVTFEPADLFRATTMRASPRRRSSLLPIALCAFVAIACATIAFLKSPLAVHPKVAPYANALTNAVMAKLG